MSMRSTNPNAWLLFILLAILLVIISFFPYIRTPINTKFFLGKLPEARELCLQSDIPLSEVKLTSYNRLKGEAKVYCLYEDHMNNRVLTLSRVDDKWLFSKEIKYSDPGEFIWPYYY